MRQTICICCGLNDLAFQYSWYLRAYAVISLDSESFTVEYEIFYTRISRRNKCRGLERKNIYKLSHFYGSNVCVKLFV